MKRDELRELTIERAASCRAALLEALVKGKQPVIDVSRTAAMDLSGIQNLVAFFREAEASRLEAHLTGSLSPEVRRSISIAGLCDRECETGDSLEKAIKALL